MNHQEMTLAIYDGAMLLLASSPTDWEASRMPMPIAWAVESAYSILNESSKTARVRNVEGDHKEAMAALKEKINADHSELLEDLQRQMETLKSANQSVQGNVTDGDKTAVKAARQGKEDERREERTQRLNAKDG